jgi:hypothetical protein
MKKIVIGLVLAVTILSGGSAFTAPVDINPVTVSGTQIFLIGGVQVPETFELTYWILSVPKDSKDPYGSGVLDVTQEGMNFGDLTKDDVNNILVADHYFAVFLLPQTRGRRYLLTQTSSGIVNENNGSIDLNASLIMAPLFRPEDELGGIPQGDKRPMDIIYDTPTLSYGGDKPIFNCLSGEDFIVRCYYGIATGNKTNNNFAIDPAGAKPVDYNKLSGTYRGTITFTLTAY